VVVTTYNRAELLKNCLDSLCQQTLDHSLYEIIVVDNHSTDNTRQIVETFQGTGIVRYFMESQLGMNTARNLGLKEACGAYVAYIDDDALADPNWLEVAAREIAIIVPMLDCLGGPIFPFYTSTKPEWFEDKYEIRRDWDSPRYLRPGQAFSGSNMIWKKEILEALGGFDSVVGVVGNSMRFGGETIVFSKIWSARDNPQLYFSPDLIVHHWVPAYKMKVLYRIKRNIAQGQYFAKINRSRSVSFQVHRFFWLFFDDVKNCLRALISIRTYSRWQNWVIEEWAQFMISIGELLGMLGIYLKLSQNSH
jgi:glycosyltransferase involved in cell wall biosynthesis